MDEKCVGETYCCIQTWDAMAINLKVLWSTACKNILEMLFRYFHFQN